MNSSLCEHWWVVFKNIKNINFYLGPCRYDSEAIENGNFFVISGTLSNPKFLKKSVDGTYAVGLLLFSRCNLGFELRGPQVQTCKASGNWEQKRHKKNEPYYLTPNHPADCLPGNTNNIFHKLLTIKV